jgi:hypothetical protein
MALSSPTQNGPGLDDSIPIVACAAPQYVIQLIARFDLTIPFTFRLMLLWF